MFLIVTMNADWNKLSSASPSKRWCHQSLWNGCMWPARTANVYMNYKGLLDMSTSRGSGHMDYFLLSKKKGIETSVRNQGFRM